jgi:cysteine desulfurase
MDGRERKDALFEQFARVGKALSSPKRLELIDLLAQGERTVEALARTAGLGVTSCSAHLQALRQANVVSTRRAGAKVFYRLAGPDVADLYARLRAVATAHSAEAVAARDAYLGHPDADPVDRDELLRRAQTGAVTVLDVRPAEEYAGGHIPGALSIPLELLADRLADLPADGDRGLLPRRVLRARGRRGAAAGRPRPPGPAAGRRNAGMAPGRPARGHRGSRMNAPHPGLAGGPIYLDYNATTPVDPRVVEVMLPYLAVHFGNPSSGHPYRTQPRAALAAARAQVAALIGAAPAEVVFTGSGSEADLLAVRGAALAAGRPHPHVITQATEHPAVLEACRALHRLHGVRVTVLPVDGAGLVDPATLAAALDADTVLVSVMAANNETGALQPIPELAELAHRHGALLHCDAAQAAAKIPLDVTALGADLLTVVGHKMYAPKGIAALYVRDGVPLEPVIYGGGQERGLRAGTENVALAVALGAAAQLSADDLATGTLTRIAALRDDLHHQLATALPGRVHRNGPAQRRLPNTLNVSIDGVPGHELLAAVPEIAASTGSACHSGTRQPSPVLTAMGQPAERALAALRLSLGRWSTPDEINRAAGLLAAAASTPTQRPAGTP